ncbi:MAG TPA: PA2169 family four-helix-bundle protein, partial [Bryobacteraceae bacterium]|nr:PA2169 family four-helix-bundle protein [Bryobacteraceae bacterium]
MINTKTLKALHDLVATCNDASEGFAKAAKGVHDADLSNWLAQASADRGRFANELSHAIKELGDRPEIDLHEGGILHKGWVDLEQRLRSTEQHLRSKDDKEI